MDEHADNVVLTYSLAEMDTHAVCQFIQNAHWGKSLSKDQISKSFKFSSCAGLMHGDQQIGFARAISDRASSAYLKDFIVFEVFQRKGFGRLLMEGLLRHPELSEVPSWYLGTKDAHDFYTSLGFKKSPDGIYMYLHR